MAEGAGPAAVAVAVVFALVLSSCSSGEQTVEGPVTVYASLPLSGERAADGEDAADGARLALEQAGGRAGGLEVRAEFLDDSVEGAAWDPVRVGENARAAAQDSSTAAYIGELDSEPTRASAPITNAAGIVQISPGAGGVDLTGTAAGYPDAPDRYRPSGDATFARVIPADEAVARAAVTLAAKDALTARIVSDGSLYGDLTAEEMRRAAEAAGLGLPPKGTVDVILRAGGPDPAGQVTLELPGGDEAVAFRGALDPGSLPEAGFTAEFRSEFGRDPGPYAAYGYEAMQLALFGVAEAEGEGEFRPAIRDAVLGATRQESVLGPYAIDDDGDTDLCSIQPYVLDGTSLEPEAPLCVE